MRNLEINDFINYNFLSKLKLSPDGRHAAFVVSRADLGENGYKCYIHILDTQTKELRQLTYAGDSPSFIWYSDTELIFPSLRLAADKEKVKNGEKLTVYHKININGGEASEFFRLPYQVTDVKKLGGGRFAICCYCHPSDEDFDGMDENARKEAYAKLAEERDYEVLDEIPFWSNGDGFTNKKRTRLFIYEMEGNRLNPVTGALTDVSGVKVKGSEVLYTANSFSDKYESVNGAYCYNCETGETRTIVPETVFSNYWADFYRGGFLVEATNHERYGMNENAHFYYCNGDGKMELFFEKDNATGNYTNSDSRLGGGTTMLLHKEMLYYTEVEGVKNTLKALDKNAAETTLFSGYDTIDGFDAADSGLYFFGLGGCSLHELFELKNGKAVKLSDFNGAFMAEVKTSEPEYLTANGEAETIEGFVMKPVDFDANAKYPAILHIHGGPKTAFGNTYFHEANVWANNGYFVLFCNPWGSDGRGNHFADLRGRYGTIDYNDLMAFTDKAIEAYPQIDDKRIAVGGGSYGGFMTNWIIGHTNRFCAAVSMRSISNWISKFGTTDIGYYFNADQIQATPWNGQEKLWDRSPVKYADKCVTPTLFIHSEEDYRCWLPEGLQMFTALKYHGCDARLCMFRGENHELSRSGKPKHRIRRMKEILDWFDKYCK